MDYKTGKIPDLKYSDSTNQRIMDEKFYQLQVSKSFLDGAQAVDRW